MIRIKREEVAGQNLINEKIELPFLDKGKNWPAWILINEKNVWPYFDL